MEIIRCPHCGKYYNPQETPGCPYCGGGNDDFPPPPPPPPQPPLEHPDPERPIVGWLVCTEGNNRGSDYRVRTGANFIGRAQDMDICIPGDSHISNKNAGMVVYDDLEHLFYVSIGTGHNVVRLNGKMVLGQNPLNAYDRIKLGETTLTFIPLCGERFDWSRYDEPKSEE